jgi:hypothetical protein
MNLLACVLRPNMPTHDRPPCSSLPSPEDLVPIVLNLINIEQVAAKNASQMSSN